MTICEKVAKMKNRAERPPTFALEIPGNAEVKASIKEKISVVKENMTAVLQQKVTNADVLEEVLKYWICGKTKKSTLPQPRIIPEQCIQQADTTQKLFITTKSSFSRILSLTQEYMRYCSSRLTVGKCLQKGHVTLMKMQCRRMGKSKHSYWW